MSDFSKKWRKRWNLSQEEAGKKLGVTGRTIRKFEAKELPLMAKYAMLYLSGKWRGK